MAKKKTSKFESLNPSLALYEILPNLECAQGDTFSAREQKAIQNHEKFFEKLQANIQARNRIEEMPSCSTPLP